MNIVEASYRVGLALKKSREGKELLSLYKEAQNSVPSQIWRDFEKVGQKKWGKHFFTYLNGLAIFEANREQDNLPSLLKEEIEKVLSSNKIKIFSNRCEKFGIALEEVAKSVFSPTILKTFANIDTPPKLVRALQDLGIFCQRTGLFKFFLQNYKSREFMEKMNEYGEKREDLNSIPYSHKIRKLIRDIANEKTTVESIYVMEAFSTVLDTLKQVIFESYLDLILNLNSEDIKIFRERKRNKLALFSIELNEHMLDIMNWNGSIISFNQNNKTCFALVNRRKLSWMNQDSTLKIRMSGIMYPNDDLII